MVLAVEDRDILQDPYLPSVNDEVDKIHGSINDVYLSVKVGKRMTTGCISQGTNYFP